MRYKNFVPTSPAGVGDEVGAKQPTVPTWESAGGGGVDPKVQDILRI